MAEGGSILCCRPLGYRTAKTGGAVNGGAFAPFILTVDRLGWVCYLLRGHCVSTVGLNEATIAKYIREQESHDIALDKLSVKEYEDPFKRG